VEELFPFGMKENVNVMERHCPVHPLKINNQTTITDKYDEACAMKEKQQNA
jgi:hypothetical protein